MKVHFLFKMSADKAQDDEALVKGDKEMDESPRVGAGDQVIVAVERDCEKSDALTVYQCRDGRRCGRVINGEHASVMEWMRMTGREMALADVIMENEDGGCLCGIKEDAIYDIESEMADKIEYAEWLQSLKRDRERLSSPEEVKRMMEEKLMERFLLTESE